MATILLVHGAWHGGECWQMVQDYLETKGHHVIVPTLLGVGTNYSANQHRHIRVGDHADQIVEIVRRRRPSIAEALIVVGHSYGGLIVSEAARQVPGMIDHLVLLDAMFPYARHNTTKAMFTIPSPPDYLKSWVKGITRHILQLRPVPPPPNQFLVGLAAAQGAMGKWLDRHLTPMPLYIGDGFRHFAPLEQVKNLPITYIAAHSSDPDNRSQPLFSAPYEAKARELGWPVIVQDCDHDVMLLQPKALADHLIALTQLVPPYDAIVLAPRS